MPYLHKAYQKYKDDGFSILSVAMKDKYKAVSKFRANKWSMPWHHSFIKNDSNLETKLKIKFDIDGYPTGILVNRKGKIIATELEVRGQQLLKTLKKQFQ